ncbi:DUF4169 family protein [Amaricoccus sp.]|uniref:DUF4169 family protein n=1 Tax=Amaricoccus sp. TaxID=1872485 RepID=UPI001B4A1AB4|nr:DUF4169 family protein [Amaricoccus sp.]MBP7242678.1 DUF4169 family protein [Amaricoccus sp.]
MSEIVNLRTVRKRMKREAERTGAAIRAAAAGEGRSEKRRREAEAALEARRLDQSRRDPPGKA